MNGCVSLILIVLGIIGVSTVSKCTVTKYNTMVLDGTGTSRNDISEEKQLAQSPVFDTLPACALKSKAQELFNAYNEREHALAQAQGRLNRMLACNRCSKSTHKKLSDLVASLRTQNNELKTQYESLLTQAEVIYAQRIAGQNSEFQEMLLQDADRLLDKHRSAVLVDGESGMVLGMQEQGGHLETAESRPPLGGETPASLQEKLWQAVANSDADRVAMLVKQGANADKCTGEKGKSAVHLAVERGSMETVKALVAGGAGVNKRDANGRTPLYAAIRRDDAPMVEYLISAGAQTDVDDKWQITPREYAQQTKCGRGVFSALRTKRK